MIAYILIVMGFMMRLAPHAPNMVPIAAIAIFAGSYLNKKAVPWVPLAIMVLSDLIIGLHGVVFYTWGAFIIIGFLGMRLRENRTPLRILGTTVSASLIFFVITNFGVFLAWYPQTWQGFTTCYIKALPFLRNTMISNVAFAFVFFGLYELARKLAGESRFREVLLAN